MVYSIEYNALSLLYLGGQKHRAFLGAAPINHDAWHTHLNAPFAVWHKHAHPPPLRCGHSVHAYNKRRQFWANQPLIIVREFPVLYQTKCMYLFLLTTRLFWCVHSFFLWDPPYQSHVLKTVPHRRGHSPKL